MASTDNKVTIIDYGMGNLFSVRRAFESQGAEVEVSDQDSVIERAERLVLPGVGAFADGMEGLKSRGLIKSIQRYASSGRPFMGICLGMQMMLEEGEEFGKHEGLGLIPGRVIRILDTSKAGEKLKVPHIGWNGLVTAKNGGVWKNSILNGLDQGDAVYFVHSFTAKTNKADHTLAVCDYGGNPIVASVTAGNVSGCQFHPERSGPVGLRIIQNFMRLK